MLLKLFFPMISTWLWITIQLWVSQCQAGDLCKHDFLLSEEDWARIIIEKVNEANSHEPDLFDIKWEETPHLGHRNISSDKWYPSSGVPYSRNESQSMLIYMTEQMLTSDALQLDGPNEYA